MFYTLKINNTKINATLEVSLFEKSNPYDLPILIGEKILYADLNLPTKITDDFSGIGSIILNDSLTFFKNHPKFGQVDGMFGYWIKSDDYYKGYGGQSINLTGFWNAMSKNGGNIEASAFETFTGNWAKKNDFKKVVYRKGDIKPDEVLIKFLKDK